MKTLLLTIAALFLFASVNSSSIAQPKKQFNKRINQERMMEKLNLTKEQEDKISELRSNHQKKMADFKAELQKARIDVSDLQDDSDLSRSAMISAVEKVNSIRNKIALESVNHRMDVYELLNWEQKEIWRENKPMRDHNMRMGFRQGCSGNKNHNRMRQQIFDND